MISVPVGWLDGERVEFNAEVRRVKKIGVKERGLFSFINPFLKLCVPVSASSANSAF